MQKEQFDSFDVAILQILQVDNLTPQKDIAEEIGLSAAAVQRRIKRLRQTRVITADTSIIDPQKFGGMVTLIVEVSLSNETIEHVNRAKDIFQRTPQVQQCYYVTGDYDFLLIILTGSMQEYEKLTHEIFFGNSNIKKFRTSVSMDTVKGGMTVPIG